MRLRREDDRLNLACELSSVDAETGEIAFTMTSQPKTGLDAEDFLGAVIKCNTVDGNVYATLTSVCSAQTGEMKIISACGKIMFGDKAYELAFAHIEAPSGTVTENVSVTRTA